ncbi:MAG: LysR substrate-binding domain-containing protein [Streptosporangiaceae bacterium]
MARLRLTRPATAIRTTAKARNQRVGLADVAGEPFIDFTPGWGNRAAADRAFAAAGLDREVRFEVADFGTAAGHSRPE